MTFTLQLVITTGDGHQEVRQIASVARTDLRPETLGLTLAEAKTMLKRLQEIVVEQQASAHVASQQRCPDCGQLRPIKGYHDLAWRTPFGQLTIHSPRLHHCPCRAHATKTFSPLADLLPERTSPELLFLETKWASLASYGLTAKLLADVLPIDEPLSPFTIRHHLLAAAERLEQALGDERACFIEGCPRDWEQLPSPDGPLTVGIDGGFIRAPRKQGHFEVIAGKSILAFRRDPQEDEEELTGKCFAFVQTFDEKPKRRLFEVLKRQGMQENQQVEFFSDGGEDVRTLPFYLHPQAEHLLDWFHVTMRLTALTQTAKGLPETIGEDEEQQPLRSEVLKRLESLKWYLWHGNVFQALQQVRFVEMDLEGAAFERQEETTRKLLKAVEEFGTYLERNQGCIPNFGERYRNGERISTGFVESAVNQVVSKRMAKKQQMQWTQRGAHLLLQVRTRVLNGEWEEVFRGWYPGFRPQPQGAAA